MRTPLILLTAALVTTLAACSATSTTPTTPPPATGTHTAAATGTPATAAAKSVGVEIEQSSLGPILTDQNGRTLYAFTADKGGKSTCSGQCIATWPALTSRSTITVGPGINTGLLSHTTRTEGTDQSTYNGWPLYYYVGDVGPGDVDGQAVNGVWFTIGADGKLVKKTT